MRNLRGIVVRIEMIYFCGNFIGPFMVMLCMN
jgi:hypothetical protein